MRPSTAGRLRSRNGARMPAMRAWAILTVLLIATGGGLSGCITSTRDTVRFAGPPFPPTAFAQERARQQGRVLEPKPADEVIGHLARPTGPGPFPAVVLLHGCSGRTAWNRNWLGRLVDWGYVVLDVDSHQTRGITRADVCGRGLSPDPITRAHDAFGAKRYLSRLDYVDPSRIAVMGASQGGITLLQAIQSRKVQELGETGFRAAVALYPQCPDRLDTQTPLLILIGEADNWTPPTRCRGLAAREDAAGVVSYVEYPGAHHGFDIPNVDIKWFDRYIVRHDATAERDAIRRVREFLARTMG